MDKEEKQKIYEMAYALVDAYIGDAEQGSHWLTNLYAEKWVKKNKLLSKAINDLLDYVKPFNTKD